MRIFISTVILIFLIVISFVIYAWIHKPWERLESLDILNERDLDRGAKELKRHNVVIAGMVRDNVLDLYWVRQYIEYTGGFFKDYRVIIFENDSVDGTKWFLHNWAGQNNKVKILSEDFGNTKRPSIKFLADARNHYIDELNHNSEYKDFDMVMVLDMDMSNGWDMRGIFDSFSKINSWDIVCSNGLRDGKMYDMFAFRNHEFPDGPDKNPDFWDKTVPLGQKYYPAGDSMIPVFSCFGGMAFYKRNAIKDCRYDSIDRDCEHIKFHKCASDKNKARIFMNPSQIIRYFSLDWLNYN